MVKKKYVFVLFEGTLDAINFESELALSDFGGRLVPVPSSISASCGMCWMEEAANKDRLLDYMKEHDLIYSSIEVMEY